MKRIAIFASGRGSNALSIIQHFEERAEVEVGLILSNKKSAGVLNHADDYDIAKVVIGKEDFKDGKRLLHILKTEKIDLIVLAGFLWLIPPYLISHYPNKIVNIHPALLPKYGGKGMYGHHIHKAVKAACETESGITIHFVNERYDEGRHILQMSCPLDPTDSAEQIGKKVLALEHKYFPIAIEQLLEDL